jgi:hypothetical protein
MVLIGLLRVPGEEEITGRYINLYTEELHAVWVAKSERTR